MEHPCKIILDSLVVGMQVERDIISKDGAIIIKRGTLVEDQGKRDRMYRILFENAVFYLHVSLPAAASEEVIQQFREMDAELNQTGYGENQKITDEVAATFKTANTDEIAFFQDQLPEMRKNCYNAIRTLQNDSPKGEKEKGLDQLKTQAAKGLYIKNCTLNSMQILQKMKEENDTQYQYNYQTAITAYNIGEVLKLPLETIENLYTAGFLANIGLSSFSEDFHARADYYGQDQEEFSKHVLQSFAMLKDLTGIDEAVKNAIICHHETMDAAGYPLRRAPEKIPLPSRIILVAELYTYYNFVKKLNPFSAVVQIRKHHMNQVDLKVLLALEKTLKRSFIGQEIVTEGNTGEIIMVNDITSEVIIKMGEEFKTFSLSQIASSEMDFV